MIEKLTKKNINIIQNSFIKKDIVLRELENNPYAGYLIYTENKEILAYLYYSIIYDRTEINLFEVREDRRNQKIGSKLLERFLKDNPYSSTLEVKKDNISAISLYKRYGYKPVAVRENYYSTTDAILMERKMK